MQITCKNGVGCKGSWEDDESLKGKGQAQLGAQGMKHGRGLLAALLGPIKHIQNGKPGRISDFKATLFALPWCSPWPPSYPPRNDAALEHMAFLHCQVEGISLSSSSASDGSELVWGLRQEMGHLRSSAATAVANSAVKYVEHLEREFNKVWPK